MRSQQLLVWTAATLLLSLSGCAEGPTADQRQTFNEVEIAFQNADSPDEYMLVAGTYQQLRNDGLKSVTVLFNQGNAFARAEQYGHAIACYRQALRLEPQNGAIRTNLQLAIQETGAAEPPIGWFRRIVFWHDWLGYETRFYLATLLLVATSLVLIIARKKRSGLLVRAGLVLVVLTAVTMSSAAYDWYRFEATQSGAVIADDVLPRTGNGTSYGPAFNQPVPAGTEFSVIEQRGNWLNITISSAGEGWVTTDEVALY